MKRKRAGQKKLATKKPTPSVNLDEQVFINSVLDEINNDNNNQFDQVNVGKHLRRLSSSSSSSSSDNEESFNLEIDSSDPDEPATVTKKKKGETSIVTKKKRSIGKNGWQKKGEASRQTSNFSVMPPRGLVPNVTSSRQTINSSVMPPRGLVPNVTSSRQTTNSSVMPPRGLVPNVTSSRGSGSKVMPSKMLSSLSRKELTSPKISSQDPRYNKLELKTSLAVIKKVMQMDEAGPFNAPVDPVSQGLHDYFTVIDTPMDFGTIFSDLHNGVKYMNSDDVFKDVNYIWENCCNYNKKGDYIVYLMKRVKKKFMSYWKSAGLRTEIPREHSGHSHSMPSSDHAMWQSRNEALSVVNRMVTNSNRMQQDKLGTSQPQPQLQPYQSRQPQPSTTQVPLSSQLHAGEGSSYTDQHSLETCVRMDSMPNVANQLEQNNNEGIGSMAKFLEMRKRQSLETCVQDIEDLRHTDSTPNVAKKHQRNKNEGTSSMANLLEMRNHRSKIGEQSEERMDATETRPEVPPALPNAIEGIGERTKRYRGRTNLDAIQTRKFKDKNIVNLNKDKQPTAVDDKTLKTRLRKRQSGIGEQSEERMDATETRPEVPPVLPNAIEGIGQAKTKRSRGRPKLDTIQTSNFEGRKVVNLNKDKQSTGVDDKILKMRLRNRQSGIGDQSEERRDASEAQPEVQLVPSNAIEGIGQAKTRRHRGQTMLDAVHSRNFRKIINLNKDKQPTADDKTLTEFSNFLGTLGRRYVRLDYISWRHVPCKDELWNFVQEKYVISEDGRPWVMRTIADAWRTYKSRIKLKHFTAYGDDNERRKNRPDFLSDKEFETLLQFWNDDKVKIIAQKNSTNRKKVKDQHTCGPVGFARIREKLQLEKPDQAEPSKAELFVATRKRNTDGETQEKIARIEEKLSLGGEDIGEEDIEEILGEKSSHGPTWLVGRLGHVKSAAAKSPANIYSAGTSTTKISEEALQQIKAEVREEVKIEVKEEIEKAMQAQLANMIQRLGQMNPTLNLNLDNIVAPPDTAHSFASDDSASDVS